MLHGPWLNISEGRRSAVIELLELESSGVSKLISNLIQSDMIEPVSGYGKGKYKFRK